MRKLALAAVALSIFAAPAFAGPNEDAIAARQAYFKKLGGEIGPIAKMLKSGSYDAAEAQKHGDNLAELAKTDITVHFIPGTSIDDMPGVTEASAKIWDNKDDFTAKFMAFQKAAANMKAEAGKGKAQLAAALGQAGASCKSCHDSYRQH